MARSGHMDGVDLEALQPSVRADATPSQLAATIPGIAGLLAHVDAAASPDARGFHPAGMADPSCFAGMGCADQLASLALVRRHDGAIGGAVADRHHGLCPRNL